MSTDKEVEPVRGNFSGEGKCKEFITGPVWYFNEGVIVESIDSLQNTDAQMFELLKIFESREGEATREALLQKAFFLQTLGQSHVLRYEFEGRIETLLEGRNYLRSALEILKEHAEPLEFSKLFSLMAPWLVQVATFTASTELLREVIDHTEIILADESREKFSSVHNLKQLAQLKLGELTGDPRMVEKAYWNLHGFFSKFHVRRSKGELVDLTLLGAMADTAHQRRSAKMYRNLVFDLKSILETNVMDRGHLSLLLAGSLTALGEIVEDKALVEEAIEILDGEAIQDGYRGGRHLFRLGVHQQRANSHFALGAQRQSSFHCREALKAVEEALSLVSDDWEHHDFQTTKLLVNRGVYQSLLSQLEDDSEGLQRSEDYLVAARKRLSVEGAPVLCGEIEAALFDLRFATKRWVDAFQAFQKIEEAWRVSATQKGLSAEVHTQRALVLRNYYPRAAICHLELGRVGAAAALIDRSRAQQLLAGAVLTKSEFDQLDEIAQHQISNAADRWEDLRRRGGEFECRDQWEIYRDLTHQSRPFVEIFDRDPLQLISKVPSGGVCVQLIVNVRIGLRGIAILDREPYFSVIEFPAEAMKAVSELLFGVGDGGGSWRSSYFEFRGKRGKHDGEEEVDRFQSWSRFVDDTITTLGTLLMEPVHDALLGLGFNSGAQVVLFPPGELSAVPLVCATLPGGKSFNQVWSASIAPNSSLLLTGEDIAQERHHLVVVSPTSASKQCRRVGILPFSVIEGSKVGIHLEAESRQRLREENHSIADVIDAFNHSSIVHFACHGAYSWEEPDWSAMVLPSRQHLSLGRLRTAKAPERKTRLVYLSCCESGIAGRTLPPDEFVGIIPTFLSYGVQAAIGSLWPVYDDAAMLMADRFYQIFLGSDGRELCSPAEALAQSQEWMRTVTIGELVEEDLFNAVEALELAEARFATRRLRIVLDGESDDGSEVRHSERHDWEEDEGDILTDEQLGMRPYRSPVDWAAFVVVGC